MRITSIALFRIALFLALLAAYLKLGSPGPGAPRLAVSPTTIRIPQAIRPVQQTLVFRNNSSAPIRLLGGSFGCTRWGCVLCQTDLPLDVTPGSECRIEISIRLAEPGTCECTLELYTSEPDRMVVPVQIVAGS